jgi:hypothetical protein
MKKKNKNYIFAGTAVLVAIIVALFFTLGYSNMQISTKDMPAEMVHTENQKFIELSTNGNSACFGQSVVYSMDDSEHLTGSCCDKMSQHRYEEQVEGLKKYSYIEEIPSDPYDIPVDLAKKLLDYDSSITLSVEQQKIYEEATNLSNEGGPCCCKCWRWDVYEGLAKYLIIEHGFTAEQVAEVWNLSDGCGGEEHADIHS